MKTKSTYLVLLVFAFAITITQAQNYKAPNIDASGRITDKDGKHIGDVTKEGKITDESGAEIAHVDATGELIDTNTGKKLGKAEKNGNFVPYLAKPKDGWATGAPMNGTCLIKDKKGNI